MSKRPNLVFIFSDQQRYDTLRCYGNDWIQTPNLNRLADQSYVFDRAYATQPVCTPARASIVTGLYPHSAGPVVNRIPLPADKKSVAEMVSEEYYCGWYGKWHLGDDVIRQHGFDDWISVEDYIRPYSKPEHRHVMSDLHKHLIAHGFEPAQTVESIPVFMPEQRAVLPENFQMASFLGDRASEFIESNRERSFVLYVSTFEPHPPFDGPFNDQYDPQDVPAGPTWLQKPEGVSRFIRSRADYYMQFLEGGRQPGPEEYINHPGAAAGTFKGTHQVSSVAGWRRIRANYIGGITLVDRMVGKILDVLDNNGLTENTFVVFTSDHGEMLGDHGMLEKRTFYEEASRVPLLMRVPWLNRRQKHVKGNVSHIDLVPTLLELLGEPVQEHLQGKSLVPVLRGEKTLDGNEVVIEWNGTGQVGERNLGSKEINQRVAQPWRCIVYSRWKLNLCASDQCELFDLESDPYEQNNLYNRRAYRDVVRDLTARLLRWQSCTNDHVPLPSA